MGPTTRMVHKMFFDKYSHGADNIVLECEREIENRKFPIMRKNLKECHDEIER
jgi:hypothetical protein